MDISYQLEEPKSFFKVGDIHYNEQFKPLGVVCWVNPENIREAKIVSFEENSSYFWGKASDLINPFETSTANGAENTRTLLEANKALGTPVTSIMDCAFLQANEYSVAGETGWYMPSIEELEEINKEIEAINNTITLINLGTAIGDKNICSSSLTTVKGKPAVYLYSYATSERLTASAKKGSNPYYIGTVYSRAFKKVNK